MKIHVICNELTDHVPCSSPVQKWREKYTAMPKSTPKDTYQASHYSYYRMSNITVKTLQFFNWGPKCDLYKMAGIDKQTVRFPVTCHLVEREFT